MARIARRIACGFPHHIVQRGNNRDAIFFDSEDWHRYLFLLKKYLEKSKSALLAYCLMPNHVHLLVKPTANKSLSILMQGVAQCYAQYLNKKNRRTGRLWEQRFFSSVIVDEHYLWNVVRYIEQNPTRAKLVTQEEDYPFSSAHAHVTGKIDLVLNEALFDEKQRENYTAWLHQPMAEKDLEEIRDATRTEKFLGTPPGMSLTNFCKKLYNHQD